MELTTKECIPNLSYPSYPGLSEALINGHRLHGFRSGGGLRVVALHDGPRAGYGEHPYIYNALDYAEEDYQANGRDYSDVYGVIHDHYFTGAYPTEQNWFDRWVYSGHSFDIVYRDGQFIFSSPYTYHRPHPKDILELVRKDGIPREYQQDGMTFLCYQGSFGFGAAAIKCISNPNNIDPFFVKAIEEHRSESLRELIVLLDEKLGDSPCYTN